MCSAITGRFFFLKRRIHECMRCSKKMLQHEERILAAGCLLVAGGSSIASLACRVCVCVCVFVCPAMAMPRLQGWSLFLSAAGSKKICSWSVSLVYAPMAGVSGFKLAGFDTEMNSPCHRRGSKSP